MSILHHEERIKSFMMKADGVIFKPFNEKEVNAIIENFAEIKRNNELLYSNIENIVTIIEYTEQTIEKFNPFQFDFYKHIDNLKNIFSELVSM